MQNRNILQLLLHVIMTSRLLLKLPGMSQVTNFDTAAFNLTITPTVCLLSNAYVCILTQAWNDSWLVSMIGDSKLLWRSSQSLMIVIMMILNWYNKCHNWLLKSIYIFCQKLGNMYFLKLLSSFHLNRNNLKRKPIAYDHFKISKFNRHLPSSDFV